MRPLALLMLLLIVNLSFMVLPGYSSNSGKYYTYVLISEEYENDKLVVNDSVVFKLVEVNETAYRIVLVKYNKSSILGRQFEISIELLMNKTGGIVTPDPYSGVIRGLNPAKYTLWLPPDMLEKAVKAADMVNNEKTKVCSLYEDYMSCSSSCREKYQNNLTSMRECRKECLEKYNPLLPLEEALLAPYSPSVLDLTGVICGRVPQVQVKSVKTIHSSSNYVFELEATQEPRSTITVKSIYSDNGWLIYSTSERITEIKNTENGQIEHVSINSIKIIDTNDDEVEKAMKNTAHLGNIGVASPLFSSNTETIAITVGVITLTVAAVVIIKKLLQT